MWKLPWMLAPAACLIAGQTWTVRLEEPTGLYRRDGEVVGVPLARLGGHRSGFLVLDADGRESPWQVSGNELLFQGSVVPGDVPEYRVYCCVEDAAPRFENLILARKVGMRRVEFGNSRFRAVLDTGVPAIIEAYNLSASAHRVLNLVETSPESARSMEGDLHKSSWIPAPAVPGVEGENTGWTSAGGAGPITNVEILESGPLRGRIRLEREGGAWEFLWTAGSPAVRWRAPRGFRFAAVSASPYLPFNRFLDTPETVLWPDVSSREEPDDHLVAPRPYRRFRGGHGVYYQLENDYGALGIVPLDDSLDWTGLGSRRFLGSKPEGVAEIAITFPKWAGFRTLLEARRENCVVRQPLLVRAGVAVESAAPEIAVRAPRELAVEIRNNAPPAAAFRQDALSLDGEWELSWCEKGCQQPSGGWRKVHLPGTAHVQWLGAAKAMTREAEWVSYKEWWYRKRFRIPDRFSGKRVRLQFEATDYYADTWLNGRYLGRHEGYIDPYEFDVNEALKTGAEQELLVRVWTPVHYYWRHRPYTVKGSYGGVDQKPDDITALGITRSVRLVAGETAFIQDIAVDTRLSGEGSAEVEVQLQAAGIEEGYRWELTLAPANFAGHERIRATADAARRTIRIPVAHPQLWWTWDHGKPNLYTLDVRLLDAAAQAVDGRTIAVGIREIEKIGWQFYLNRKRMFIRGTNYYYNLFLSEMNRAAYERDIDLMLGMNVNMIRLHGHFTNREFYDLADERGVLLWQDYLEAWYPEDHAFSLRAAALYDNHIRYVRNHPSVAVWTTSDEESLENYRDLTKHLTPRASLLDPQRRTVIRSTGRYGDTHVYYGWYGGSIWDYATMNDVFVSELGATSLPNYETLIRFLPNHWPIRDHAAEWMWRKLQIPEAMRAWGDPGQLTLKEYIPRTQAYTARLFQIALERARRLKAQGTGGILHFHAIDIWPSVTMAAIDIDRRPARTYYTVQRSFAPVLASIEYDRDQWKPGETVRCGLWAINDRWDPLPGARIEWSIIDAGGRLQARGAFDAPMEADSSRKLGAVEWQAAVPGSYELRAEVKDASGQRISENRFEFEVIR